MLVFSKNHVHFALAVLKYLLSGRLFKAGAHRPIAGHVVPDDFVGVGVAASDDPAVDDYIIARLKEAGIRRVRLDFTYGDDERPASRLLERLCGESFRVMLHLVQPFESASRMADQREQTIWRAFVANTLDSYGDRVDVVEIGSTINRKRWAGYSLSDFLVMWDIAYHEVRSRGITLAGPSVTDFEPFFNIGVLSLLKKRGQLPDVHTDNLFSERCTEPERYDHKVFGRRLASVAKVNLVTKAAILQRIGAYFGVPKLLSPAAFWTLPRIERMLPDSEQKQADYLSRYMVLCAASGALEGAWWGPLICHREGLIDDGDACYPELERITHYGSVTGLPSDLRPRSAFAALVAFNQLIPGTRYEGPLICGKGLEVHSFRSEKTLIHVLWTVNGCAAALADIYSEADIIRSNILSHLGGVGDERPSLVTESPLYFCWPASDTVEVRSDAMNIRGLCIHRHVIGKGYHFLREHGVRGVVLAKSTEEAYRLFATLQPKNVGKPSEMSVLRHARNAVWMMDNPNEERGPLVLKQPVRMPLYKRLLDRRKPSKSLRSWSGTNELLRRGIGAAQPIAWVEQENDIGRKQNLYVCEFVRADFSVRKLMTVYANGVESYQGVSASDAYSSLSQFLRAMHNRGVFFRDLSGGNILVNRGEGCDLLFRLIDTGRIRVYPTRLSDYQCMADLVRVGNKLHWRGRELLMMNYLGRPMGRFRRLLFLFYDLKVEVKRRFGRKFLSRIIRTGRGDRSGE